MGAIVDLKHVNDKTNKGRNNTVVTLKAIFH